MWRPGQVEHCVFCGRTVEAGEERVGRGESAAHASCADAAFGDDRLWDGVGGDSSTGAGDVGDERAGDARRDDGAAGASSRRAARGGCLAVAAGAVVLVVVAILETDREAPQASDSGGT